jgi:acetyltransferase-like isoleucine patch superfamily enzyme
MSEDILKLFHALKPGVAIKDEWSSFSVPKNIEVGENVLFDSSHVFKKFFSELPIGLKVGNHVTLYMSSLATEPTGYIEIGDYSYLSNATIACYSKVIIGKYVYIAGGATIVDTDFHPLDAAQRLIDTVAISTIGNKKNRPHFDSLPVIIEDDVWIGYNATILKGVTIGKGSIIQPGTVVSKNIPAGSIVIGNPAEIEPYEYA